MQKSSKQVIPKRNLLLPWIPHWTPLFPAPLLRFSFGPQLRFSYWNTLGCRVLQLTGRGVDPGPVWGPLLPPSGPWSLHHERHEIVAGNMVGVLGICQLFCLGSHHCSPSRCRWKVWGRKGFWACSVPYENLSAFPGQNGAPVEVLSVGPVEPRRFQLW